MVIRQSSKQAADAGSRADADGSILEVGVDPVASPHFTQPTRALRECGAWGSLQLHHAWGATAMLAHPSPNIPRGYGTKHGDGSGFAALQRYAATRDRICALAALPDA